MRSIRTRFQGKLHIPVYDEHLAGKASQLDTLSHMDGILLSRQVFFSPLDDLGARLEEGLKVVRSRESREK